MCVCAAILALAALLGLEFSRAGKDKRPEGTTQLAAATADTAASGGDGLGTTPHECVAAAVEGSSRLYGMLPKAGPLDMHDWCVVGAWVGASAAPPHVAREPFVGTATSRSSE